MRPLWRRGGTGGVATLLALVAAAACVQQESSSRPVSVSAATAATCPRARPRGCTTQRTLAADAAPVLARHCWRCHSTGADSFAAQDHDFTNAGTLRAQRARVLAKVAACVMPPDRPEAVTPDEATAIMEWALCGD
jgi:hypothetical protein